MIRQLTLVGVGLIGGSLALALRRAGAVERIVGVGRRLSELARAVELGVIDEAASTVVEGARGADMVVLGVPLGAMREVFGELKQAVAEGAVVTDVGSAKGAVIADAEAVFGSCPARFVPGHPIAGTEGSGVGAAFAELYDGHRVILTPLEHTEPEAVDRVTGLWEAAGAEVVRMDPGHHDEVLAATSHLPHALAYALVDALSRWDDRQEIFEFAAGGFRDFTRIASSDPAMWRDICLANRRHLGAALRRYLTELTQLTEAVEAGDAERLEAIFENARAERQRFLDRLEGRRTS